MLDRIGFFRVESRQLRVSDPACPDPGAGQIIRPVRRGMWRCNIRYKNFKFGGGRYVTELLATHEDAPQRLRWASSENLSIESGQMAIYSPDERDESPEAFIRKACALTSDDRRAGLFDNGCVSWSGHGDGMCTTALAKTRDGLVVGIRVLFT